jgi:hypothetical protein
MMIRVVRGDQWDKEEIRMLGVVWVHGVKKKLKMTGIKMIRAKMGIQ